jgi:hypothetical protein
MATIALLAEIPFVHVLFLMAVKTPAWCCMIRLVKAMAFITVDLFMSLVQKKITDTMIKPLWVKGNNVMITTFVFGMACPARLAPNLLALTMETALVLQVMFDIFVIMTCNTQHRLRLFIKQAMTAGTVFFQFVMGEGQGPRHQSLFKHVTDVCLR